MFFSSFSDNGRFYTSPKVRYRPNQVNGGRGGTEGCGGRGSPSSTASASSSAVTNGHSHSNHQQQQQQVGGRRPPSGAEDSSEHLVKMGNNLNKFKYMCKNRV